MAGGQTPITGATSQLSGPSGPSGRTRSLQANRSLSREEMIAENPQIRSTEQAKKFLDKHKIMAEIDHVTVESLSFTLLSLAHSAPPKILQDGARAVAILLMDEMQRRDISDLTSYVQSNLESIFEKAEDITNNLIEAAEAATKATEATSQQPPPQTQGINGAEHQFTYATALKGNVPLAHSSTLARARAREKQILVDKDPQVDAHGLDGLTERELVAKANEAISQIAQVHEDGAVHFVGAKRLNNGGIVFDLDSTKDAQWIQTHRADFLAKFSATSIVKDRAVSVILEYVPINYSPDTPGEHRKIEKDSKLPENSLIATRWIKPPQRRNDNQRSAHLIAQFNIPEAANRAIRDGVYIAGKHVWGRRLKKEPRRCVKCQKFDAKHFAAQCNNDEACGTCSKPHRTADCSETDLTKYHCTNCKEDGHAAWDRMCPKFTAACDRVECTDPESMYKFFPQDAPWTWEQRGNRTGGQDAQEFLQQNNKNQNAPTYDRWNTEGREEEQGNNPRTQNNWLDNPNPMVGNRDNEWRYDPNRHPSQLQTQRRIDEYATQTGEDELRGPHENPPPT